MEIKEFTLDDMFLMVDIASKLDIDKVKASDNQQEYGMNIIKACLKGGAKVKKDFYQLVANITEKEVDEVRKITLKEFILILNKVKEINDISEVFTQVKDMI